MESQETHQEQVGSNQRRNMKTITLFDPLDMHVHFRNMPMLEDIVPYTAKTFSGALVMPNTDPPITTEERLHYYQSQIVAAKKEHLFMPYMTLYFQTSFTTEFLTKVRPHILAIKLYPKGMTTNSDHGVEVDDPSVYRVLADMEDLGIPLCVHGESKGFVMHRESNFLRIYDQWARQFPKLKIIMEHITTKDLVHFLGWYENVFATITPHHLVFTTDDVLGDGIQPHHYCKPIAKEPKDLAALRDLAMNNYRNPQEKVMLGTDSAPHIISKKECACGCAGVFNAPFTLQLLAQEFMKESDLEHLQRFISGNAQKIYGIQPLRKKIVLEEKPFLIPDDYNSTQPYNSVVPMWAGKELNWSIKLVS